ncbi:MAG: VWA domain-containing protein [Bacteroidales bacterium]|nr:VWA domain-containing protein [Bacteroidales bacterium]
MKKELQLNESLAALGHGKWKRALGCTLLLIGFVLGLGGMNAWGQDEIPDALKLDKYFIPDDATGHSGKLWLETYTTGAVTQVTATQPTDIVLVLDVSNSMSQNNMTYNGQNISRLAALKLAVESFVEEIFEDARDNDCEHRMAVVSFCSQNNTKLLTTSETVSYSSFNTTNFQDALVVVNDGGTLNTRLGTQLIDRITTSQGTKMDAGLYGAYGVLDARSESGGGGTTFVVPGTTTELPRNMVVVFFTDGYPTTQHGKDESTLAQYWPNNWDLHTIADLSCTQAAAIKGITVANPSGGAAASPTIWSIGVNPDCDPSAAYKTTLANNRWTTGVAAFNGLLHFISSDYGATLISWQNNTQNEGATANPGYKGYYLAASNANDLIEAFGQISSASGGTPVDLGASTVVQDVISASFTLPDGADVNSIKVYAPMLKRGRDAVANYGMTRKSATDAWEYHFCDTISGNTGTIQDENDYLGRLELNTTTGHITDSTYENRVNSSDVLTITGKTLSFTHFDFSHYYCGPIIESGDTTGYVGRKLVMVIPIEVEEGVWGDGINTNGELSFVTPDNELHYQFPQPSTNVLGDVWTEIVTSEPTDFDPDNIDSPEDLAWFISRVNGRKGYGPDSQGNETYAVASDADLHGTLTADIDMSAHNWVPIGAGYYCNDNDEYTDANGNVLEDQTAPVKLSYQGVFDGNGYVITGLKNNASKYYKMANEAGEKTVVVFPGMFANVEGDGVNTGVVKNVFVLDADFRGKHHDDGFVHHGIIADTLTGGAIYNCEAVGRLTCNNDTVWVKNDAGAFVVTYPDSKLVFGGLVGFNDGGTIHSSMAMATLTGYSMGGLVGENDGTVANSFTNGVYNYIGTEEQEDPENDPGMLFRYVGGLVGRNHHWTPGDNGGTFTYGSVDNCYVLFQRDNSLSNNVQFGLLAGTNQANSSNGSITNCYFSQALSALDLVKDGTATDCADNYFTDPLQPSQIRFYRNNDNVVGGTLTTHTYTINGVETTVGIWENGTALVDKLNANNGNYASWKRSTAGGFASGANNGGNINSDYPILQLDDFTCVASTDGIALDYANSLGQMLYRHNNGNYNENTTLGESYMSTQHEDIYKGTIFLYDNDEVSAATSGSKDGEAAVDNSTADGITVVYIGEDVSLLQDETSTIDAYTGQNIIDYGSSYDLQSGNRWHNVSSSLQNSMFGWGYGNSAEHNWETNPCGLWLDGSNADQALFPTDLQATNPFDFYCFFEPEYHWINFKRKGDSHWHMDDYDSNIDYYYTLNGTETHDNETQFIPGKGYLLALHTEYFDDMHLWTESKSNKKDRTFLQNRGTLNNGNVDIPVTYTTDAIIDLDGYKTGLEGYNLLGNPYQSYLDFDLFVEGNSGDEENSIPSLWEGSKYSKTYAVFDPSDVTTTGPKGGSYIQYMANSSKGSASASRYINMHQGFFIQVGQNGTAHFTNDMRTNTTDAQTGFRGEQPTYPLINFTVTDYEGETDLAVLELNRPENDGAKKLRMGSPAGRIYFRYDNTNLAIYFRNSDKDYQTLNFSAEEDGNFTLSWNMANADFSSLTLVDNITGIKTDMLTHDHYTFEGRVDDYNTRFKIVFGEMNNNEEEEPVLEHFAFFDHGNLIVNGTGHFEVVDVMGRVLYAVELTDTQNTVSLPSNVRGVCMLCFTRNNETKVQKMVIQ